MNVFRKSIAKVTILLYDFFIQGVIVPPTITHVTKLCVVILVNVWGPPYRVGFPGILSAAPQMSGRGN